MPPLDLGTGDKPNIQHPDFTILMPCLDEFATIAACIAKARACIRRLSLVAEVLVADNGSTDCSPKIAQEAGARVVIEHERGYGSALRAGIAAARGTFVIMGDADDSYDFSRLDLFVDKLREGCDLVVGNRFLGGIAPGAMPRLHYYLGNPLLSGLGRLLFNTPCRDFHCGLRGFRRDAMLLLGLQSTGMEFASEMIAKASRSGCAMAEVATTLGRDGRGHGSHLRSLRDGWRHVSLLVGVRSNLAAFARSAF